MTVADWNDIRFPAAAANVATSRPDVASASGARPGQLARVAARGGTRRSALPPLTQLTAGSVVVSAASVGVLHDAIVRMLVGHHWVAAHFAAAILTWPTGLAQVVCCLAGAAVLVVGIVASAGMRSVDEFRGWVMLAGGGVAVVGLAPTVIAVLMYLVIGVLWLALCLLVGALVFGLLLGALR